MKKLYSKTVPCNKPEETTFPCLMESTKVKGLVYLMTSEDEGTRVATSNSEVYPLGSHSDHWDIEYMEPYNGTVNLTME